MRIIFWVVLGLCLIVILGTILWFSTSLHTLGVLASQEYAGSVLGSKARNTLVEPFTERLMQLVVPKESKEALSAFSDWVYARGEGGERIAGTLAEDTSFNGWQVHNAGLLTVLTRTGSFDISPQDVGHFFGILFDVALGRAPIQPNVLLELKQTPGPISLIGKMRGEAFYFAYSLTEEVQGPLLAPHAFPESIETLKVALPSSFLEKVPVKERNGIENSVITSLGLTKARPDLFKLLESIEVFGLEEAPEGSMAIGFTETNSEKRAILVEEITKWIALERGYITPVTRAFRLPDGTVGYEYIPDANVGDGLSVPGTDGCQISFIGDRPVWLCQKENTVTLGTSPPVTQNLQNDLYQAITSSRWHVFLPASYAAALPSAIGVTDPAELTGAYLTGNAVAGEGMLLFRQ